MAADGKSLITRYETLKNEAGLFRTRWEFMAPYLAHSRVGIVIKYAPGSKLNPNVYDSTSEMAAELMAQFIAGQILNPAQVWGSMRMRDPSQRESDAINEWLEESTHRMLAQFADSMFYAEAPETLIDWGGFGTGYLTCEELPQAVNRHKTGFRGFHFETKKTGRFLIADGPDGLVDTGFDDMEMTAKQIDQRWGRLGELPENVKRKIQTKKIDETFTVIHCIYPRPLSDQRYAAGAKKMPFASVWVEKESKEVIYESGFPRFPAAVPRYQRTPGETYGRGRGDIAFADIWTLNQAKRMGLEDWALKIRPPILMRHDSVIGTLKLIPAGPTTINTHGGSIRDSVMPFETGSHPEVSQIKEEELRKSIRQIFYVDQILQLLEVNKSEMTAFEFAKKLELLFQLMGPVYGRTEHELLRRIWDIAFEQMYLAGAFSPPPPEIFDTDGDIEVVFENPLARAQRSSDVQAISLAVQDLLPLSQVYPQIWDRYDPDELVTVVNSVRGVPTKVQRNGQSLQQFRQDKQQQQAEQQALATGSQLAEAGGKVAPLITALQGGKGHAA